MFSPPFTLSVWPVWYPARPEQEQLRIVMATRKVPEMRKQIRDLESRVNDLSRLVEQLAGQRPGLSREQLTAHGAAT